MKLFLTFLLAVLVVGTCEARRGHRHGHSHRSRSSGSIDNMFKDSHWLSKNADQEASYALSTDSKKNALEVQKIKHKMELERLKYEQVQQKMQLEENFMQRRLRMMKLKKEMSAYEQTGEMPKTLTEAPPAETPKPAEQVKTEKKKSSFSTLLRKMKLLFEKEKEGKLD